jgi:hypothetical protein
LAQEYGGLQADFAGKEHRIETNFSVLQNELFVRGTVLDNNSVTTVEQQQVTQFQC